MRRELCARNRRYPTQHRPGAAILHVCALGDNGANELSTDWGEVYYFGEDDVQNEGHVVRSGGESESQSEPRSAEELYFCLVSIL